MRKHSVRKWIHAVCDLLPLLVIPIFALAVRSDNNFEPIDVEVEKDVFVDFNQQVQLSNLYDYSGSNYSLTHDEYLYSINIVNVGSNTYPEILKIFDGLVEGHKYYLSLQGFTNNGVLGFKYFLNGDSTQYYFTNWFDNLVTMPVGINRVTVYCALTTNLPTQSHTFYVQLYDFTQMFGAGNEISVADFKGLFPQRDFAYTLSEHKLVENGIITYSDTDVGSQMVYTLYNTCDKYFNFNQVGVFQDLYNWFEANILGGTAPMSFFIVWNVILYEFIMDLIFLTYMVFMFIIDFTECMIDRFFEKSYRGGR